MFIHVIMKTICLPGYHHNGFFVTHAPGHMMYSWLHNDGAKEPKRAQQAKQGA